MKTVQRSLGGFGIKKSVSEYGSLPPLNFIDDEIEFQLWFKKKEKRKARNIRIFGYSENEIWKDWNCDLLLEGAGGSE